jgi:hypothetical protein
VARPRLAPANQEASAYLLAQGLFMNQSSQPLGVAYGTVCNDAQKQQRAERVKPLFCNKTPSVVPLPTS